MPIDRQREQIITSSLRRKSSYYFGGERGAMRARRETRRLTSDRRLGGAQASRQRGVGSVK
jgi:hypothetical protein